MINETLQSKTLPPLSVLNNGTPVTDATSAALRREELKKILQENEYGKMPEKPEHLSVTVNSVVDVFCAGNAILRYQTLIVTVDGKDYSFPFYSCIPNSDKKVPPIVFLNFRSPVYDSYFSPEEIMARGYAVFGFNYQDVTEDNNDFGSNLAAAFVKNRRSPSTTGKIAIWAWAAMRVLDYAVSLPEIDASEAAVIGHSRLGKTALVAGAFDERFKYVISNDSGCCGSALSRGKEGESIEDITRVFPFWFCPKLAEYKDREFEMPFDQHFLTALIAPRYLLIGSAEEDHWADPASEFLNACAAGEAYKWYGKTGVITEDKIPVAPYRSSTDGNVFYQVRKGIHFLSHFDWYTYLDFIDAKRK